MTVLVMENFAFSKTITMKWAMKQSNELIRKKET